MLPPIAHGRELTVLP